MKIIIDKDNSNIRLDIYMSKILNKTRSNIDKHISNKDILVNNKPVKNGYNLKENDIIEYTPWIETTSLKKENIPLDIIYEDDYLLVVNKPSGLVVHSGNGNHSGTLVNALLNHTDKLSNINSIDRPGIVHRIDKDTSGLLLVSKNNDVHSILVNDFKNKNIKRKYIALVSGVIESNKVRIDAPIGRSKTNRLKMQVTDINSKRAITNIEVLERYKTSTLIRCILETGRTHQIRVHTSYIGHPVINDPVYNKSSVINDFGQMLHAYYLAFTHPITKEFLEFSIDPPQEFNNILSNFKNL